MTRPRPSALQDLTRRRLLATGGLAGASLALPGALRSGPWCPNAQMLQ